MDRLVYVKYSTDRDSRFAIRTERLIDDNGNEYIKKIPLFEEGVNHIKHMVGMYEKLHERYKGKIEVSASAIEGKVLSNEFVKGESYATRFERLLDNNDKENIYNELEFYKNMLYYSNEEPKSFQITPEFERVFGKQEGLEEYSFLSYAVTDIDMIFENIIIDDDGKLQLIDYEWTFDFPIPREYVLFRTYDYLFQKSKITWLISREEAMRNAGISGEIEDVFQKMENSFQKYVVKNSIILEKNLRDSDIDSKPLWELEMHDDFYEEGVRYREKYFRLKEINENNTKKIDEYREYIENANMNNKKYNELKDLYVSQQTVMDRIKKYIKTN